MIQNVTASESIITANQIGTESNLIIRHVKVDRSLNPQEVLDTTGRRQYTDPDVVASMPKGEGDEVDVVFFNLDRYVTEDELEKEYELRGLKSADPYSLAAVNRDDPTFADTNPNGTHWKGADGKWCSAAFGQWDVERRVGVDRRGDVWSGLWWFAGVRK